MTTHAGRPRMNGEDAPAMITITISLSPADAAELAAIGDGNRSAGGRLLLAQWQQHVIDSWQRPQISGMDA